MIMTFFENSEKIKVRLRSKNWQMLSDDFKTRQVIKEDGHDLMKRGTQQLQHSHGLMIAFLLQLEMQYSSENI